MSQDENAKILHLLGRKWAVQILVEIDKNAEIGFNELKKILKTITSSGLSNILKESEELNLIKRKVVNQFPIHTCYSLTENGRRVIKKYCY